MNFAKRMNRLQTGIFSEISCLAEEYACQGGDVINLSVGSPDLGPAPHVLAALAAAVADPARYGYALSEGMAEFKKPWPAGMVSASMWSWTPSRKSSA